MKRFFVILLLISANLFSQQIDSNTSIKKSSIEKESILEAVLEREPSIYKKLLSLDYIQKNISYKILVFSSNLDYKLKQWVLDDTEVSTEEVVKSIKEEKDAYSFYSIVNLYDGFFKNETYLSTTNKSYIRIRWGMEQNSEEGLIISNNIRVNLRLPKTEDALYFFIGDDEDDEVKTINKTGEDKPTSIGIKYILDNLDVFNVGIFAGFTGIDNPYIKLRVQYPIAFENIFFRPIQYIEYSLKDEFMEETRLYFDYRLASKKSLVRLSLGRYTQTSLKGMNYSAQLSYSNTIKYAIGYKVYTNLSGRTEVASTEPVNTKYNITPRTGIYKYSSGLTWKQQFFKKYLFYQIQPSVEFAQQYDYNANYIFRANLELYFGDI